VASIPVEVGHAANVASVAAYTDTGQITTTGAHPPSVAGVDTPDDPPTAAAGHADTKGNGNGNGKTKGNGKGKGSDKKDD
jgi:hypothetical protein